MRDCTTVSPFGTKRTVSSTHLMSAFDPKRTFCPAYARPRVSRTRIEPIPAKKQAAHFRLFGSFHVHVHGRAGTYKIPVSIDVVDAVHWGPILIDPESADRETRSFSRIGAIPFA